MNKNLLFGGIIAVLIVIGVVVYSSSRVKAPGETATSTPVVTTGGAAQKAGIPILVTSSKSIPTDTTAVVTGSVTPNGAFTSYWYEYGNTTNMNSKTPNQSVGSGFVSINSPAYITGLVKDTTYYFRLVAENEFGKVTGTQFSFQTTHDIPTPIGSIPTIKTLQANTITRTSAKLNGEVNPNKATTQYWFEYGRTANLGNTSAFLWAGEGSSNVSESITLSDLTPDSTYYFRLNAQNQFGTVNGTILNFKTSGPSSVVLPAVKTSSATNVKATTATLRGTVDPNGDDTMYWFEYSTDSLLGSVLLKATEQIAVGGGENLVSVTSNLTGLSSATTYYFRVVAKNSLGTVIGDRMSLKTK